MAAIKIMAPLSMEEQGLCFNIHGNLYNFEVNNKSMLHPMSQLASEDYTERIIIQREAGNKRCFT
jgi:hypothetical protein